MKKAIRRITACLLLCILSASFWLPAYGASEQNGSATVTIKVAFYPLDGFFEYDANGNECGYGVDYLNELKKYANIDWEYVPVDSWEGIKPLMLSGDVDVRMPVSEPSSPSETYSYSVESVLPTYHAILTRAERTDLFYQDYDAISKMKIAVNPNLMDTTGMSDYLASINVLDNLVYFDDYNSCRAALDDGTVDGLITNIMDFTSDLKILDKFSVTKNYITTLKDSPYYTMINSSMTQLDLENPSFQTDLYEQYYADRAIEPFTKEESEFISNTDHLTVAVFSDRRPMSYYDKESGSFKGIAVDIANALSEKMGIPFEYVPITTETPREMLDAVDLVMPVDKNDDSGKYFITPGILDLDIQMAVRDGDEDIASDAKVGVLTSTVNVRKIMAQQTSYELVQFDSNEAALKALLAGRIDGFANVNYVLNWQLENPRYDGLHSLLYQGIPIGYSICGSAEDTELRSILTKVIRALPKSDIDQIIGANTSFSFSDLKTADWLYMNRRELIFGAVFLVLLVFAFILYNRTRAKNMAELERHSRELETANQAKNDFLARMSHDMRTPMNGILGLSYIIEDQIADKEVGKELRQLRDSGEYLLQLINDVLDIDKVESGKLEIYPEVCDEELVFNSIIELIEPQAKKKNITFNFKKINIYWKWMMLDAQRVKQIFINLLTNAVKFTPEGGKIDFTMELVSETETMIRDKFVVQDNGIGMSADFVQHAFEPFAQENRLQEGLGGTGLGLSIVKSLVELMGGSITVESQENHGTTFTLFLNFPLAQKPENEQQAGAVKKAGGSLKGLHILLCEDHPLNAQIATKLLEKQDAIITTAENGKIGVETFSKSPIGFYDVILMDIRMPELDGIGAAKAIRAMEREDAKTVPIIAMTANAYEEDIHNSLSSGMNAHLAKPIEPQKMYDTILEFTKQSEK